MSALEQAGVEQLLQKHPLERDGIVEELYHYMWEKDHSREGEGMHAFIPDTIVFKNRVVTGWFFTSLGGRERGIIKRKVKANISNEAIEEAFLRKTPEEFDIVAVYIENPEGEDGTLIPGPPIIEYMNQKQLHDFLHKRRKGVSAILQKFIEPKGGYNEVIRAIWSPHLLSTERRKAKKHLYDTRLDVLERCAIYDAPEHYSEVSQVKGQVLSRAITMLCEGLAEHIASVTHSRVRIARVVLNLKVASDGNLYLLTSTSLRVESPDILQRHSVLRAAALPATVGPLASVDLDSRFFTLGERGSPNNEDTDEGPGIVDDDDDVKPVEEEEEYDPVIGAQHLLPGIAIDNINNLDGSMLSAAESKRMMSSTLTTNDIMRGTVAPVSKWGNLELVGESRAVPTRGATKKARRLSVIQDTESPEALAAAKAAAMAAMAKSLLPRTADRKERSPSPKKPKTPDAGSFRGPLDRFLNRPIEPIGFQGHHFDPEIQCPSCGVLMTPQHRGKGKTEGQIVQVHVIQTHFAGLLKTLGLKHYIPVEQPKRKVVRQAEKIEIQSPGHEGGNKDSTGAVAGGAPDLFAAEEIVEWVYVPPPPPTRENFWPAPEILAACSAGIGVYGAYPPINHGPDYEFASAVLENGSSLMNASLAKGGRPQLKAPHDSRQCPVPEIPPALGNMAPLLTVSEYRQIKKNPIVLKHGIRVCDDCFMGYSVVRSCIMAGNDIRGALVQIMGIEGMRLYHKYFNQIQAEDAAAAVAAIMASQDAADFAAMSPSKGEFTIQPQPSLNLGEMPSIIGFSAALEAEGKKSAPPSAVKQPLKPFVPAGKTRIRSKSPNLKEETKALENASPAKKAKSPLEAKIQRPWQKPRSPSSHKIDNSTAFIPEPAPSPPPNTFTSEDFSNRLTVAVAKSLMDASSRNTGVVGERKVPGQSVLHHAINLSAGNSVSDLATPDLKSTLADTRNWLMNRINVRLQDTMSGGFGGAGLPLHTTSVSGAPIKSGTAGGYGAKGETLLIPDYTENIPARTADGTNGHFQGVTTTGGFMQVNRNANRDMATAMASFSAGSESPLLPFPMPIPPQTADTFAGAPPMTADTFAGAFKAQHDTQLSDAELEDTTNAVSVVPWRESKGEVSAVDKGDSNNITPAQPAIKLTKRGLGRRGKRSVSPIRAVPVGPSPYLGSTFRIAPDPAILRRRRRKSAFAKNTKGEPTPIVPVTSAADESTTLNASESDAPVSSDGVALLPDSSIDAPSSIDSVGMDRKDEDEVFIDESEINKSPLRQGSVVPGSPLQVSRPMVQIDGGASLVDSSMDSNLLFLKTTDGNKASSSQRPIGPTTETASKLGPVSLALSPLQPGGSRPSTRLAQRGRVQSVMEQREPTPSSTSWATRDVVGEWSFEGIVQPRLESGVLSAIKVVFGTRPYMAIVRKADPSEVAGITWPKLDVNEVQQPDSPDEYCAIYLRSFRSSRTVVQYVRVKDMRESKNEAVLSALECMETGGRMRTPIVSDLPSMSQDDNETKATCVLPEQDKFPFVFTHGLFSGHGNVRLCFLRSLPTPSVPCSLSEAQRALFFHDEKRQYPLLKVAASTVEVQLHQPVFTVSLYEVETGRVDAIENATFARLVARTHRTKDLHFLLIYAAKCQLAAIAGYGCTLFDGRRGTKLGKGGLGGGSVIVPKGAPMEPFRPFAKITLSSYPDAGSVARLVPGHWLGGRSSLDRDRGFIAEPFGPVELSEVAKQGSSAKASRQNARKAEVDRLRKIGVHVSSSSATASSSNNNSRPGTSGGASPGGQLSPAISSINSFSNAEVKETFNVIDLATVAAAEADFSDSAEVLPLGTLARSVTRMQDGLTQYLTLSFGFMESKSSDGSASVPAPQFVIKIFSSTMEQIATHVPSFNDLPRPLADPFLFKDKVLRSQNNARISNIGGGRLEAHTEMIGNPFIDPVAFICNLDIPVQTGETLICTRFVAGDYVHRFVGARDMGSVGRAIRTKLGPHPSIQLNGSFLISLWVRLPPPPTPSSAAGGAAAAARSIASADKASTEGEGETTDSTPVLPTFRLRCQYLRQPITPFQRSEEHDARMAAADLKSGEGVSRKNAAMVSAEMQHWVKNGTLPSASQLVAVEEAQEQAALEASGPFGVPHKPVPCVHMQQSDIEPVYEYELNVEDLCQSDLNPFIELMTSASCAASVQEGQLMEVREEQAALEAEIAALIKEDEERKAQEAAEAVILQQLEESKRKADEAQRKAIQERKEATARRVEAEIRVAAQKAAARAAEDKAKEEWERTEALARKTRLSEPADKEGRALKSRESKLETIEDVSLSKVESAKVNDEVVAPSLNDTSPDSTSFSGKPPTSKSKPPAVLSTSTKSSRKGADASETKSTPQKSTASRSSSKTLTRASSTGKKPSSQASLSSASLTSNAQNTSKQQPAEETKKSDVIEGKGDDESTEEVPLLQTSSVEESAIAPVDNETLITVNNDALSPFLDMYNDEEKNNERLDLEVKHGSSALPMASLDDAVIVQKENESSSSEPASSDIIVDATEIPDNARTVDDNAAPTVLVSDSSKIESAVNPSPLKTSSARAMSAKHAVSPRSAASTPALTRSRSATPSTSTKVAASGNTIHNVAPNKSDAQKALASKTVEASTLSPAPVAEQTTESSEIPTRKELVRHEDGSLNLFEKFNYNPEVVSEVNVDTDTNARVPEVSEEADTNARVPEGSKEADTNARVPEGSEESDTNARVPAAPEVNEEAYTNARVPAAPEVNEEAYTNARVPAAPEVNEEAYTNARVPAAPEVNEEADTNARAAEGNEDQQLVSEDVKAVTIEMQSTQVPASVECVPIPGPPDGAIEAAPAEASVSSTSKDLFTSKYAPLTAAVFEWLNEIHAVNENGDPDTTCPLDLHDDDIPQAVLADEVLFEALAKFGFLKVVAI
jgi:hypothetical protein